MEYAPTEYWELRAEVDRLFKIQDALAHKALNQIVQWVRDNPDLCWSDI